MKKNILIIISLIIIIIIVFYFFNQQDNDKELNELVNSATVYCSQQGGRIEARLSEANNEYKVCVFQNGLECKQWEFFRGECDKEQGLEERDLKIDGLEIEILKEGEGMGAKNGDMVSVHYTGTLEDGTKFDSSLDKDAPFDFILGSGYVIKGWDKGVLGMKVGEKRKLRIASFLGYGESGMPNLIPPNAILIFEIELLNIN